MKQVIQSVAPGSVGAELGLEPGDAILSINGTEIEDVLDYYFLTDDEAFTLEVETKQGEVCTCEVEKSEDEDMGLGFAEEFMGCYKHCANKCVFCFIDQLPKGMRQSLYFKDDDSRLSFLNGNYITMTNMAEKDFQKIIRYHMSPINVSVHTTNPELRVKMLKNPRAAEVMDRLHTLVNAGITLNGQIVLCKGLNDGAELDRTLADLSELCPAMQSLSIVPVGISAHREGLYPLDSFTHDDAVALIQQVAPYRAEAYKKHGLHFVHLADEFYALAGLTPPTEEVYDGYLQIENGVGMMRSFMDEAYDAIKKHKPDPKKTGKITLVTAPTAAPYIEEVLEKIRPLLPNRVLEKQVIRNEFFGEKITVTGLLTGTDVIKQLKAVQEAAAAQSTALAAASAQGTTETAASAQGTAVNPLGDKILLPGNMFRGEETILLDDLTLEDIEKALHTPCVVVKSSGRDFAEAIFA